MHILHTTIGAALPLLAWAGPGRLDPECVPPLRVDESYPGKPAGGLWTSPLDPAGRSTAWTRWCARDRYDRPRSTLTVVRAVPTARVLVVDNDDDVSAMDRVYGRGDPCVPPRSPAWPCQSDWEELTTRRVFDWAAIAQDFDAVHLTPGGLNCGGGVVPRLRWDVPSVWFPRHAVHIGATRTLAAAVARRPHWASPRGRVGRLDQPRVLTSNNQA
jgi:hypothetical protein